MKSIRVEKDSDNIIHLILDNPNASANVMDGDFTNSLRSVVQALSDRGYTGIIVRSAKSSFFAGGDLNRLYNATEDDAQQLFQQCQALKEDLRWLETQGKPVVAAINGAALGGGWEIALSCHHRIAIDRHTTKIGLPEVTLGLLPGGGGCVRMSRLLGMQSALPYLLEGRQLAPVRALAAGLIHQLAKDEGELLDRARAFVLANAGDAMSQPWDRPGYQMPGGDAKDPLNARFLIAAPAMQRQRAGAHQPAPAAILSTVVEAAQVDFDTATRIESRYFVQLACGQVAKNMIGSFWFGLNAIKAGASLPASAREINTTPLNKVGILGAGMMGAGIAYACAAKGVQVVLKDVSAEAAAKGKDYAEKSLQKRVQQGSMDTAGMEAILDRIHPTTAAEDLRRCELVVEAVFEDRALKARVTADTEAQLAEDAIFASNTSTLPITGLAEAAERPQNFIGLHFFSPAEKMPLVEIIRGEHTSDATIARAFAFAVQIGKTPIVVNDSRGFFTSRVFGCYTSEAIAMLGEGVSPALIENAALLAGFPVGPLAVSDEVSLALMAKIRQQTLADIRRENRVPAAHPADTVIDRMLALGRAGKAAGGGFYDYPEDRKKCLWPALRREFPPSDEQPPLRDLQERLLFTMVLETLRCYDEGVLRSVRDANIGSIFGIGFPPWTGGALQYINQYGPEAFCRRALALSEVYGQRLQPTESLRILAAKRQQLRDEPQ
ncbi:3-hydroxyacyl-CoA dehydrogenase NAD-binding domain-containing protein [Microbulbifer sp. TYP-18]|uniref:3-hydroxyacyl-CoA dehydrogenase NAD-binding domain-containing protein n=1 Tax=Microbulbifer sp. TYP-18 TaxID=3230024 RepID=UPI0034C6C643